MHQLSGTFVWFLLVSFASIAQSVLSQSHEQYLQPQLVKIFENCHKNASNFDPCIKTAFNDLRVYFKSGELLAIRICCTW